MGFGVINVHHPSSDIHYAVVVIPVVGFGIGENESGVCDTLGDARTVAKQFVVVSIRHGIPREFQLMVYTVDIDIEILD